MIQLSEQQLQKALNAKSLKKDGMNEILKMTLNALMYSERKAFLDRRKNPENKANGYRSIKMSGYGRQLSLSVPRDRLGVFKPLLVLALKEEEEELRTLCYELYREGLTTRKISNLLENIYGKKYDQSTISTINQSFKEELAQWRQKTLDAHYHVVYLDALHTKVRRETVEGEAFYVALAVKENLKREIIAIENHPTESATGWDNLLQNLKERGLQEVDLFVADGLIGLEEKVLIHYPKAHFQKCVIHFKRNLLYRVRTKDKQAISADLANIFNLQNNVHTKEKAYELAKKFKEKWESKYSIIKKLFLQENLRTYLTYLKFDTKTRLMIYTTNWIERLNKEFRRALKIRNAMPSVDSVLLLLSAIGSQMEKQTYDYPVYSLQNEPLFQKKTTNFIQ